MQRAGPPPEDPDFGEDTELGGRDTIADRLSDEVSWLRQCADWLAHLDADSYPPAVNLRPSADWPDRAVVAVDLARVAAVAAYAAVGTSEPTKETEPGPARRSGSGTTRTPTPTRTRPRPTSSPRRTPPAPRDTPLRDFSDFYEQHYDLLLSVARFLGTRMGGFADAHDIVQDTFLVALRNWDHIGRLDNTTGYLIKVAQRLSQRAA